jgi:predicted small integral membrane protein
MNSALSKILVLLVVIAAVAGVIVYKQYSRPNDVSVPVQQQVLNTDHKLPEVLYFSRFT